MSNTIYDPVSTAQNLATATTAARQALIKTQTTNAQNTSAALTKLRSALSSFDSALAGLSGKTSLLSRSATFSGSGVGTATASASAVPGTYSFFVEQLASAHQIAYSIPAAVTVGGTLVVKIQGSADISVNLTAADTDGDNNLSAKEIAAAINVAVGSNAGVTASTVTVNGESQLVLTATDSGAAGAISLDASGAPGLALGTGKVLVEGQDAIVWLGAQGSGVKLQQNSNTFHAVEGVSMTFTRAMAAGEAPATLTVATDDSSTVSNVQSFVDAYNKLNEVLNSLTKSGDAASGVAASIFASDAGVRALRNQLNTIIRENVGGLSLTAFGVTANRDGSLALDSTRLKTKLAANPTGLATVFGSTAAGAKSGVLGKLDTYLNLWTGSTNSLISQRDNAVSKLQVSLSKQQETLDNQFNLAYKRYLIQFTQLQSLQAQMSQTTNMFDALFNNSSKN
ncbi:MAG TPA: flagellar filament capping protein FliD [Burkholderiaceae bacterium]|nr:flagellar filament capping protein FliD [Burkholderiaceae bacterium]